MRMRSLALVVASAAAIFVPVASSAGNPMDSVDGGGAIVPAPDISAPSQFEVGALSGPLGEEPTGHITDRVTLEEIGGTKTLHGDVRAGCLRVVGNRAIVVGKLPEREQFDIPLGRIEYLALIIEDNGNPVGGHPVDRAVDFVLRAVSAERFCTTFDPATAPFFPLDHGNFVIQDALL
jgi:hypothetical protein